MSCAMASLRRWVALVSIGGAALVAAASAQQEEARPGRDGGGTDAWYLVFELDPDGGIELYSSERVVLEAPLTRGLPGETLPEPGPDELRVQLSDATGRLIHEQWVLVPELVRGEFHGAPTATGAIAIEHFSYRPARRAFVVRVPAVESGTLVIEGARSSSLAIADLAGRAARVPAASSQVVRIGSAANSSNRVDLAILGDGYRADEAGLFDDDATTLANRFFSISPYAEYRNFVNVAKAFVPSAESGADHPPYDPSCTAGDVTCCGDAAAQGDPLAGTFVDTALDGRYCAFNIARLAVVDSSKVLAAAAAVPNWDRILVLLNDETYGGSGGFVSVTSTHQDAVEIARHEYGHSFAGLADEYDFETPGYPPCSDRNGPGCEPNVTDETNRSLVKWEPWIAAATPVPTPESQAFSDAVGLFEGARYRAEGMYRPRQECLMNVLGVPFGEICREEYVLDLYRGGWGVPAQGIDLIEPRSVTPPPNSTIEFAGEPVRFEADLLQPVGGPPLEVTWTVDGAPAVSEDSSFSFVPPGPGRYAIELIVRDPTPFVLARNASELVSRRGWTVAVGGVPSECIAGDTTLCLEGGRFRVEIDWRDFSGTEGAGQVVPTASDDSGLFSFFDPDNWEMLVKVLDACAANDRFWVFLAATTNLQHDVTVTDTATGAIRRYSNEAGNRAPAVTDTDAFATCPGSSNAATPRSTLMPIDRLEDRARALGVGDLDAGGSPRVGSAAALCTDSDETLCLNRSRFGVEVFWRDFEERSGNAIVVPFRSDDSGLFYVFDPDNWELLVKVLDACSLNGHYWVFAAATTNIEYTLTVRDDLTGAVRSYQNALGTAADAITDTTAFATCP
ncbi:MAG TPA: M64 family metallopeptidase [Thermoanaerobaculia bacterium]|nr:M64 family metallopeptidase [Thermoanaerobaculia bacterium]